MIQNNDQKTQEEKPFIEAESQQKQPEKENEQKGLSKEDLPESTNESTGAMGSGQRQDSN
jgi:hypothetical protein